MIIRNTCEFRNPKERYVECKKKLFGGNPSFATCNNCFQKNISVSNIKEGNNAKLIECNNREVREVKGCASCHRTQFFCKTLNCVIIKRICEKCDGSGENAIKLLKELLG